jgi:hypothetical protein
MVCVKGTALFRLRAILSARLALRINCPALTDDRLLAITDAASRLGVSKY